MTSPAIVLVCCFVKYMRSLALIPNRCACPIARSRSFAAHRQTVPTVPVTLRVQGSESALFRSFKKRLVTTNTTPQSRCCPLAVRRLAREVRGKAGREKNLCIHQRHFLPNPLTEITSQRQELFRTQQQAPSHTVSQIRAVISATSLLAPPR